MSTHGHVDADVESAIELRSTLVESALEDARRQNLDAAYHKSFEAMRTSRIYVWEPPAIEAFWRFWDDPRNYSNFMDDFFDREGLIYRQDLACREFHMFPVPGRLFGEELRPKEFRDDAASVIFPPTTRAIGISNCFVGGKQRLNAVIQSMQLNPERLLAAGGMMRVEKLHSLAPKDTREPYRFVFHHVTRYPQILGGRVVDRDPINWLICVYQLQIFLLQPYVGHMRKVRRGQTKGKRTPEPPQEIIQVLMREPLPVRIPRYIVLPIHPVTGRKLEFEVDVRSHERHCASGIVTTVRAHKRGPLGKSREKVIKVIR